MLGYSIPLQLNAFFGEEFFSKASIEQQNHFKNLLMRETRFSFLCPSSFFSTDLNHLQWKESLMNEFSNRKLSLLAQLQESKSSLNYLATLKDLCQLSDLAFEFGNFPMSLEFASKAHTISPQSSTNSSEAELECEMKLMKILYLLGDWDAICAAKCRLISVQMPEIVQVYLVIGAFGANNFENVLQEAEKLFKILSFEKELPVCLIELLTCIVLACIYTNSIGLLREWWWNGLLRGGNCRIFSHLLLVSGELRLQRAVKDLCSGAFPQAFQELASLMEDFFIFGPSLHRRLFGNNLKGMKLHLKGAILGLFLEIYREISIEDCARALGESGIPIDQLVEFIDKWKIPFKIDQQAGKLVRFSDSSVKIPDDLLVIDRIIVERAFENPPPFPIQEQLIEQIRNDGNAKNKFN